MRELQPTLSFDPALLLKAQGPGSGIRAAVFDVDGVLTDGRLFIGERGEAFKAFHVLDGHGLKLLAQGGITPVIVTGRDSPAVRRRIADLGLQHAYFGVSDKLAVADQLCLDLGIDWPQLAVIGDDWPDLPAIRAAGFGVAVANAHDELRSHADYVTRQGGGRGAVREVCDLLLKAQGLYAHALAHYL